MQNSEYRIKNPKSAIRNPQSEDPLNPAFNPPVAKKMLREAGECAGKTL
jgi:hypothetical protein